MHARPYTQSNACAVVHFDARLLAVSVSKCASYTVMNHICPIVQMPQHVETLQATSASKRVRKSPFIYLITHSTICYHILLHVLFPFLWMRVVGGEGALAQWKNETSCSGSIYYSIALPFFKFFTILLCQDIQYKNNLFLRGDHKVPVTQDSFQLFDQISQIS